MTRWPWAVPGASICRGCAAPWSSRTGAPARGLLTGTEGRARPSGTHPGPGPRAAAGCPQPGPGRGRSAAAGGPGGSPARCARVQVAQGCRDRGTARPTKGASLLVTDPGPRLHVDRAWAAVVSIRPDCRAGPFRMAAGGGLHPRSGLPPWPGAPLWTWLRGLPQAGGPDPLLPPCSSKAAPQQPFSPSFLPSPLPNKNRSLLSPAWGDGTPGPHGPVSRGRTTASPQPLPWARPPESSRPRVPAHRCAPCDGAF